MPEFRKDPVSGRWVIISSERAKRPQAGLTQCSPARPEMCPFCTGHEKETPPEVLAYRDFNTVADGPGWSVRVVPNKYPAVVAQGAGPVWADAFHEARPGAGVHEVIVETPEHVTETATVEPAQLTAVLRAYRDRMLQLAADKRWRYILIYKNEGREAGATLEHVHSQLIALPHVPDEVLKEIGEARRQHGLSGDCLFCTIVDQESRDRTRLVRESERFVALCPWAPRFPFETWILPKNHRSRFEASSEDEYGEFAACLHDSLVRLRRRWHRPVPFNYVIHSAPYADETGAYYHWHIEILPKLSQAAGFEWGSGSFINPIGPEEAARSLRAALP